MAPEATALAAKLLSTQPPCSYGTVASELHRRLQFETDRASVRRWAIENQLATNTRYKTPPKPVKRWQARDLGALWQYDVSPHAWLPDTPNKQALFDVLDDATRYNTGARLYPGETLLAHFDFLLRTFQSHGLPLALYVDYHSFFYTHNPDAFTQLGAALHFCGVAIRYAPTPQAKGKIERRHDFWQKTLAPALGRRRHLGTRRCQPPPRPTPPTRQSTRSPSRTGHHAARRPPTSPGRTALGLAARARLSLVAFVWSQQTRVRVGDDGNVPVGDQRQSVASPPRTTVIRCLRPDGDLYYLRHAPDPNSKPVVLLHCPVF